MYIISKYIKILLFFPNYFETRAIVFVPNLFEIIFAVNNLAVLEPNLFITYCDKSILFKSTVLPNKLPPYSSFIKKVESSDKGNSV